MKRIADKHSWLMAIFCLCSMLSAIGTAGSCGLSSFDSAELLEFEECEEILHVRKSCREAIRRAPRVYDRYWKRSGESISVVMGARRTLSLRHERDRLNGFGSHLTI